MPIPAAAAAAAKKAAVALGKALGKQAATRPGDTFNTILKVVIAAVAFPVVLITVTMTAIPASLGANKSQDDISAQIGIYVHGQDEITAYAKAVAKDMAKDAERDIRAKEKKDATPTPLTTTTAPSPTDAPTPPVTIQTVYEITTPPWRVLIALDAVYSGQNAEKSDPSYIISYVKKRLSFDVEVDHDQTDTTNNYLITVVSYCQSTDDLASGIKSQNPDLGDTQMKADLAGSLYTSMLYYDEKGIYTAVPMYADGDIDPSGVEDDTPIVAQPGTIPLPYYNQASSQWNYRDKKKIIIFPPDRTVQTSGCGPTSMAMVLVGLTGNHIYTPLYCMNYAVQHSYYRGNGTPDSFFPAIGHDAGITVRLFSPSTTAVLKALQEGHPVIGLMKHGVFSRSTGHYIVLRGVNAQGQIYVSDPGHRANCHWWDLSVLLANGKSTWVECYKEDTVQ